MICANCGRDFARHPKANNQKYCANCGKVVSNAQQRAWHAAHKNQLKAYHHRYYLTRKAATP